MEGQNNNADGSSQQRWTCEACGCNTNQVSDRACSICGISTGACFQIPIIIRDYVALYEEGGIFMNGLVVLGWILFFCIEFVSTMMAIAPVLMKIFDVPRSMEAPCHASSDPKISA
jgi:hypothetical protein